MDYLQKLLDSLSTMNADWLLIAGAVVIISFSLGKFEKSSDLCVHIFGPILTKFGLKNAGEISEEK